MADRTLTFSFIGRDLNVGRTLEKLGAQAEATGKRFGAIGRGMGLAAAGAVTAAAVVGVESIKMASTFQAQMERIHTQAGVAQKNIAGLGKGVLGLAGQVAQSPDSLAEALYHVESSFASMGITGAKAMDILKVASEGATIGGSNLVDTTNGLDAAIVSGIKGVGNYKQAMGELNAVVGSGDMKMQDLSEALGTGVLAVVKNFGVTLGDAGAALATFGDNNIRGAEAGTQLRMSVLSLVHPTTAGGKILGDMGVSVQRLTKDMQEGGLNKALTDLHDHMDAAGVKGDKVGSVLADAFGKKAGVGLSILLGQFDRFQSKYTDIQKGAKGFGDAWLQTTMTFAFQWKALRDQIDAFGIKLGTALMPAASAFVRWLNSTAMPALSKFGDMLAGIFGSSGTKSMRWRSITSAARRVGIRTWRRSRAPAALVRARGRTPRRG